jgi:hypothetical protein
MPYPVIYLANSVTTNTTTTAVKFDGDNERADLYFTGTFDGASVAVQMSPVTDGSSNGYVNVSGASAITENTVKSLSLGKDSNLRVVTTGVGASTSLTIYARFYRV